MEKNSLNYMLISDHTISYTIVLYIGYSTYFNCKLNFEFMTPGFYSLFLFPAHIYFDFYTLKYQAKRVNI